MPVIQVYQHGMSAAIVARNNSHERAKRGEAKGWSVTATRNNIKFLRSICPSNFQNENELDAIAFTLTIRDCPESSEDWHTLRTKFIKKLRRNGLVKLHWVTEWQRRGVPHLHGMAIFSSNGIPNIKTSWLDVASEYGALYQCQHLTIIYDEKGWFQYLAKHVARGAGHYQRNCDSIPEHWKKTGRVWGHTGDWILNEPGRIYCSNELYFAFRRIVRKWRLSDARTALKAQSMMKLNKNGYFNFNPHWLSAKKRIISSRKMLKCNNFKKSQTRGISEWIDFESTLLIIEFLHSQGYEVITPDEHEEMRQMPIEGLLQPSMS